MAPADQAQQFLDILLAGKPPTEHFYLWTFPKIGKKLTYWHTDIPPALDDITRKKSSDIYIGLGLSHDARENNQRVKNEDASGLLGMWGDIDIATSGHHKKGDDHLPQTETEALGVLDTLPTPTMMVNSGGGYHVYWLFDEPWIFTNDAERTEGLALARRWCKMLQNIAKELDFEIDGTGDLARVLRVAGTQNFKVRDDPKPVTLITPSSQTRYNRAELVELCKDVQSNIFTSSNATSATTEHHTSTADTTDTHASTQRTNQVNGALVLLDDAEPPFDAFHRVYQDTRFKKTWEMKRKDLRDSSSSGYEMALLDAALKDDWSDQAAINLVIAWRRKHNQIPVVKPAHYFEHSLKRAHAIINNVATVNTVADDPEMTRLEILDALRSMLGVTILQIIKYLSDAPAPSYVLFTDKGEVYLESVDHLINQNKFMLKVAETTGDLIPSYDKQGWKPIARMLLKVCEDRDVPEATISGIVTEWLDAYLAGSGILTDDKDGACRQSIPYTRHDKIFIFMNDFRKWLKISNESIPEPRELVHMLNRVGAFARTVAYDREDGSRTSRTAWQIPQRDDPPIETEENDENV